MYPIIADYWRRRGFETIIDEPKGNGITFDLFKKWLIDVFGINQIKKKIIAVEVKNNTGSSDITDALSKAQMYQNVCTESYVAFPKHSLDRKLQNEITEQCKRRGIGFLIVDKDVDMETESASFSQFEQYKKLLDESNRKFIEQRGFLPFEKEDFFVDKDNTKREIVWHKIKYLVNFVRDNELPNMKTRMERVRDRYIGGNIYDENLGNRFSKVPHFSIGIRREDSFLDVYSIIHDKSPVKRFSQKIKEEKNLLELLSILQKLNNNFIKLYWRKSEGYPREYGIDFKCRTEYLTGDYMRSIISRIESLNRPNYQNAVFIVSREFHIREAEKAGENIAKKVAQAVVDLKEFYNFAVSCCC